MILEAIGIGLHLINPDIEIPRDFDHPAGALLGFFLMGLLHSAQIRQQCARLGATAVRPLVPC